MGLLGRALAGLGASQSEAARFDQAGFLDYFCKPFQLDFLRDQSRFVVWESSRQIGKSFSIGWKALLKGASEHKRHQTIVAASQRQAEEVIDKVAAHAHVLKKLCGVSVVKGEPTKSKIELINGSRIRAVPANPRTARGLTGDLYLDELAHVQHDEALWEAVLPIITAGNFTVTATSTPLGDEGVFYRLVHPDPASPFKFSHHRTTVWDAINQGLNLDIDFIKHHMDADSFAQEYECAYLSILGSVFPWSMLRGALRNEDAVLSAVLQGVACPTYLGIDIGRRKDLFAVAIIREFPEGVYNLVKVHTLHQAKFSTMRNFARRLITDTALQPVIRVKVDETGIGMQLAEELAEEFPGLVEPVNFASSNVKTRLVSNAKVGLEKDRLTLCDDGEVLSAFHKIKRHVTEQGNMTFDAKRGKDGHADQFWAASLALDAALQDRPWDFGAITLGGYQSGEDTEWNLAAEQYAKALDRAPLPEEIPGVVVFDEDDLEDLRSEHFGDTRPPRRAAARGEVEPLDLEMPDSCTVAPAITDEFLSRGEDPCWGCDEDRRVCGGRGKNLDWKVPGLDAPPIETRVVRGDTLRDMLVSTGQLPQRCYLDGVIAFSIIGEGRSPCRGCSGARKVCGGDTFDEAIEVTHGPV